MDKLLTAEELSKVLNVPKSWIYGRTSKLGPGRIPHFRVGKYLRFSEKEVIEYLQAECSTEQRKPNVIDIELSG